MRIACCLPNLDEHIPVDRQLPNGLGLPVLVHYEGDPVGEVVRWDDQGDGTALVEVELDLDLGDPMKLSFGLDAQVQGPNSRLERIISVNAVGVWPTGEREYTVIPDDSA